MGQSPFTLLDLEWSDIVRQSKSRADLARWASQEPILTCFADVGDVVRFARQPGHPAASDEVLGCLARRSAADRDAARALLQAVLYALIPITVRFRSTTQDREDIAATVIAAAYDRIRTYPIHRRPHHIAANIVLDTRQAVSRSLYRPRVNETFTAEIDRLNIEAPPPDAAQRIISLIDEALRRRLLGRDDARLIVTTRLLDVPIKELADQRGCKPHSLRRRRLRAERALAMVAR